MKFVECKKENFNIYKKTKLQKLLDDFLESGFEAAVLEYEDGEYSSACSVASSLKNAIKRFKVSGVACTVKDNKAYLVRVSPDDCE